MKTLIFGILIILAYNICYSQTEISSNKAEYYVGEYVIVTGKIKEIKESCAGNIFLNFEKKYPDRAYRRPERGTITRLFDEYRTEPLATRASYVVVQAACRLAREWGRLESRLKRSRECVELLEE